MTWRADLNSHQAGATLFEALIALSILGLMAGIVVAARPAPSSELQRALAIAALKVDAVSTRARAIQSNETVEWEAAMDCNTNDSAVLFFRDGTVSTSSVCFEIEGTEVELSVDPLLGILEPET